MKLPHFLHSKESTEQDDVKSDGSINPNLRIKTSDLGYQ